MQRMTAMQVRRGSLEPRSHLIPGNPFAATLIQLTPAVYDDVPPERHSWAKLTLEAHLLNLARDGRVIEYQGSWRLSGV
jgi:Beta-lactamase associated winged helix domain